MTRSARRTPYRHPQKQGNHQRWITHGSALHRSLRLSGRQTTYSVSLLDLDLRSASAVATAPTSSNVHLPARIETVFLSESTHKAASRLSISLFTFSRSGTLWSQCPIGHFPSGDRSGKEQVGSGSKRSIMPTFSARAG